MIHPFSLPQEIYCKYLESVNGVPLTCREMEIIAYVLNGRGEKKIGAILSMDERAVSSHTSNIRRKLGCNSRESIIDFIEKSDKSALIKNEYYQSLINRSSFEIQLKKIYFPSISDLKSICFIVDWKEQNHQGSEDHKLKNYLKKQLIKHLGMTPIKLGKSQIKECERLEHLKHELGSVPGNCHVVSIVSTAQLTHILAQGNKQESMACFPITFIILDEETEVPVSQEARGVNQINIFHFRDYYLSVLSIVEKLFPSIAIDTIKINFTNGRDEKGESWQKVLKIDQSILLDDPKGVIITYCLKRKMKQVLMLIILVLGIYGSYYWLFLFKENNPGKIMYISNTQETQPIRSDLIIPSESMFLNRVDLMTQISDKFKQQQENIVTVALIGIGGSGKTTLARQYARSQSLNVVWEINAETKETLENSFESLAGALATTDKEKMELKGLRDITNHRARREKVIQLVKKSLRFQKNWLLIYDNVEQFSDIQKYFPSDHNIWGRGQVILTTRDGHIGHNSHIDWAFEVGELGEQEKLELFLRIVNNNDKNSELISIQKEPVKKFLRTIPSFPLDISTAAHYLKATNISYQDYLDRLDEINREFLETQQNVLRETIEYEYTRYSIIELSLKDFMGKHDDFPFLLLFISLLDSQNIPANLLNNSKENSVVDSFIYYLKKYSLINCDLSPLPSKTQNFSIHRNIQKTMLYFILRKLDFKANKYLINISDILEKYLVNILNSNNLSEIITMKSHYETFLTHQNILSENIIGSIKSKLGSIFWYLGYYEESKKLLEESILILNKFPNENRRKIAQNLVNLGAVYIDLGDYENSKKSCESSLEIYKKYFPENKELIWEALLNLGAVYKELGNYKKSINMFENSKNYTNGSHLNKAMTLGYLGVIYNDIGNYEKSREVLEQSLIIYKKHVNDMHFSIAWVLRNLGSVYYKLKNYNKSRDFLERSLLIYKHHLSENHVRIGRVFLNLGIVHALMKNYEEAKIFLEKSLSIYQNHYGENHIETARVLRGLGDLYLIKSEFDISEKYHNKALSILEKTKHPEMYISLESLADLYQREYNHTKNIEDKYLQKKSINYLIQSINIVTENFPSDSPHAARLQLKLDGIRQKITVRGNAP